MIFGAIAYYPVLLAHWPFGHIAMVRWAELFIEIFGGLLVFLGIFVRRHYRRMRAVATMATALFLIAGGSYTYHMLSETGKIDEWLNRNTKTDTIAGQVQQQIPSLVHTLRSFDSYVGRDPQSNTLATVRPVITSAAPSTSNSSRVWYKEGQYKGAYVAGAKGNPIILLNNPSAKDPSWGQLIDFLKKDPTDKQPYNLSSFVCADFAEMLHNNAEKAGWKAAYIVIELGPSASSSVPVGHTLDAFQTTDRGLVFVDATGTSSGVGPQDTESIGTIEVGKNYIPQSIFPEKGWSDTWESMGKVLSIEVIQW
jgi:hypothetical protein